MMQYVSYYFYCNVFQGNVIAEEDFDRLCTRAYAYICGMTRGLCEKVPEGSRDAVRQAVCAVAEVLQDEERLYTRSFAEGRAVSSETVGGHTVSYSSGNVSAAETACLENRKRDALLLYLSRVPELAGLFKVRSYPCIHHTR